MTISTEEIYLLNNMNTTAFKCQLGTLIYNAENVTAGEIAIADGKILIGNASGVGAACDLSGEVTINRTGTATVGVIADLKTKDETTAAYNLEIASNGDGGTAMGANRKLSIDVYNADRTIDLQGNLSITGNATFAGAITTTGAWTQTGAHTIGITTTGNTTITLPTSGTLVSSTAANTWTDSQTIDNAKKVIFEELTANGNNYVSLRAADSLAGNIDYIFPSTDAAGVFRSNGSGTMSVYPLTFSGSDTVAITTAGATTITIPTTGILATTAIAEVFENKTLEATCALVDTTDNTKTLKWNLAAQSAGVDLTITSSAELADRVITIPVLGGNDEIVFKSLAQTLASKTLTSPVLNTGVSGTAFLDEDTMVSNSATKLASQQSIKAYVDARVVSPYGSIVENFAKSGFVVGGANTAFAEAATSYESDAAAINCVLTRRGEYEIYNGTAQTLGPRWLKGSGINIEGDATENDCLEFGMGCLTTDDVVRTVGTDNVYMRAKLTIANVSGTDRLMVGWRKVQAYNADATAYTDYASIGCNTTAAAMAIKIMTDNDNAGETATDTTQTIADTEYLDVKIYVGDEAYLQNAIDLAASYRNNWNDHILDATEHTAGADTGNAIVTAAPTTATTMIAFVTEAITRYVAHDADVILVTPAHHQATSAANALASEVAPTTLAECVTRLNDLKAKYNLHEADATSHDAGSAHTEACRDIGNVWYQLGANAALADPTAQAAFSFDDTDEIVPFIYLLQAAAPTTGTVYLSNFEVVDVVTATV
jgi:hypothetical protein